jgi:hypothetical protein
MYLNNNSGYEFLNKYQIQVFLKELDFDPLWRVQESGSVMGFEQCRALTAVKRCESLDYILSNPNKIQKSIPKSVNAALVEKIAKADKQQQEDPSAYFVCRELWVFKYDNQLLKEDFNRHLNEYQKWLTSSIPHETRFGYPIRFGETGTDEKAEEARGWKQALVTRQSQYSHDTLVNMIDGTSKNISRELEEERAAELERIKVRRLQMNVEDELLHRPKKDPYDEAKDVNLKAIHDIVMQQEEYKKEKYQRELLRSISNKFVNNYFYTVKGIKYLDIEPPEHFVKKKIDSGILEELRQLGIQTLKEQEELRESQISNPPQVAELNQKQLRDDYQMGRQTQQGQSKVPESPHDPQKKSFRIKNIMTSKVKLLEQEQRLQEDRNKQKTLDYLAKMRMEFDIYGNKRAPLHPVFSMAKGSPFYELNEKAIEIEAPTDKRVKIASMSNRKYIHAPSTDEIRNEGMHQSLLKSMDKGNSYKEVFDKKKIMPDYVKNDPREKDFVIFPHQIDFGTVRPASVFKAELRLVNANSLLQRVKLLDPVEPAFKVVLSKTGPIAMGHERRVFVYFDTEKLEGGEFETEFHILSKYRKYTIPIKAKVGPNVEQPEKDRSKLTVARTLPKDTLASNLDGLFQIVEVIKEDKEQQKKTKDAEATGTITQDYLPEIKYDRNTELRTEMPDPKKKKPAPAAKNNTAIDYDADDVSGEEEDDQQRTGKSGRP